MVIHQALSPVEQGILDAIAQSRYQRATCSTLAYKLHKSAFTIQISLNNLVSRNMLVPVLSTNGTTHYHPFAEGMDVEPDKSGEDMEDEHLGRAQCYEQAAAARLWETRMAGQRWHDDPRALAENMRREFLVPPFYNQPAREI